MKMRKFIVAFLGLLSLIFVTSWPSARADSVHTTTLTIVKYGLSAGATGFTSSQTINTGGAINNLPVTDNTGQTLSLVSGISYTIQEIQSAGTAQIDISNSSSYVNVGSAQTITTESNGQASITLPDGYYIVTELANEAEGLKKPAAPVLIQLPQWSSLSSSLLDTVYIYPKSSVEKDVVTPTPPSSSSTTSSSSSQTPPSTSGNPIQTVIDKILPHTGDIVQWGAIFLGFVLIFVALLLRRKQKEEKA